MLTCLLQDRSHVIILAPRPENMRTGKLYNLSVRGKRGNLQQITPALEYGFTPNTLQVSQDDMVHIQWAGSNRNVNTFEGQGKRGMRSIQGAKISSVCNDSDVQAVNGSLDKQYTNS